MTAKDWFIVGVRLLGVWQLTVTLGDLFMALSISEGAYQRQSGSAGWYMVSAFLHFILTVWLLKFAPDTARYFYPDARPKDDMPEQKHSRVDTRTVGIFTLAIIAVVFGVTTVVVLFSRLRRGLRRYHT
jgi:hypothetical protein